MRVGSLIMSCNFKIEFMTTIKKKFEDLEKFNYNFCNK